MPFTLGIIHHNIRYSGLKGLGNRIFQWDYHSPFSLQIMPVPDQLITRKCIYQHFLVKEESMEFKREQYESALIST